MNDILVDGNSWYARSWYAAQGVTDDPTYALSLALQTLFLLMNPDTNRMGYGFDRLLVGWDADVNESKSREPKPPEYYENRLLLKELITTTLGGSQHEDPNYEGDDIIATAVYNSIATRTVIVSGDKDLQQLEGGSVTYYCLNTKAPLNRAFICSKWHIRHPNQLAIALAVIGDPVDNIKGVPNWGPKRSQKLFEAVHEGMDFEQALKVVDEQIPDELKPDFWASLERTLLNRSVPNVPEPGDVMLLVPPDQIDEFGLDPVVAHHYHNLHHVYYEEPY